MSAIGPAAASADADEAANEYQELGEAAGRDVTALAEDKPQDAMDGGAKISTLQGGIVLFKSCFGCGILGMPFAFRCSGVTAGILSLLVIALATNLATKMLVWIKRDVHQSHGIRATSIPELAQALLGERAQSWVNVIVMSCQLGCCIAYNIFIGVSLTAIVESLIPHGDMQQRGFDPYVFFILCQVLLFSLMVQMKELASMTPILIFAQIAMVLAVATIMGNGLLNPSVCDRDGNERVFCKVHVGLRPETYAIYVGIAVFAMEGIPTVLAIENVLAEPERFEEMFDRAQGLLFLVFTGFGTVCYWLYGNNTRSVVTLNVQGHVGLVVKMLLVMVIFCSYPLQYVPISQLAHMSLSNGRVQRWIARFFAALPVWMVAANVLGKSEVELTARLWGFLKMLGVAACGAVAIAVPHFGHMLSLMGCCTFSCVTFMLPPLMFLKSRQGRHQFQHVIACCLLLLFGASVTTVGLYGNLTSETVYHHKIESSPPLVGSTEAKEAQAVYKQAAGAILKHTVIYPAGAGAVSARSVTARTQGPAAANAGGNVAMKRTGASDKAPLRDWAVAPRVHAKAKHDGGAASSHVLNHINTAEQFYHDAEGVAKMEGMVANTKTFHEWVKAPAKTPATSPGHAAKAAAIKKLTQLRKARGPHAWVKVDSRLLPPAMPPSDNGRAADVTPAATGGAPAQAVLPASGRAGGLVPGRHEWTKRSQSVQSRPAAPEPTVVVSAVPASKYPGVPAVAVHAAKVWHAKPSPQVKYSTPTANPSAAQSTAPQVPQPLEQVVAKTQKSKSKSTGVSPLQRVQHALAVEKYKNALLREKEAEKEMKETAYKAPTLPHQVSTNTWHDENGRMQPAQVFRGRPMAAGTAGVGTMTSKSVPQTASQRISRPAAVPAADEGVSTARTPDPMSVVARESIVSGSDRKQPSFARGTAGVKSALPASVQPGGAGAVGTAAAASGHGPGSAATPPWPTVHSSAKDINAWAEGEIHNGKSPKETARDLSA